MVMRINSFMTGLGAIVLAALLAACSAQYDAMDEPAGAPPEPAVEAPEPAPIASLTDQALLPRSSSLL